MDRGQERIAVCFEDVDRCSVWQRRARRRGKLAGIRSISACQHVASGGGR